MKIGFIGMGNMASSMVEGFIRGGICPSALSYYDIETKDYGFLNKMIKYDHMQQLVQEVDCIILAIKPSIVEEVIHQINDLIVDKFVVSIVAGYLFEDLEQCFVQGVKHISIMPNTPIRVNQGVTLFESRHSLQEKECRKVYELFSKVSTVEVVSSSQFMSASAISGCTPAFIYMIIEAMGDAGVLSGLSRELSYALVANTMIGAATLQQQSTLHPGVLKDEVCSPGGMTIQGVATLEKLGLRHSLIQAILACNEKS